METYVSRTYTKLGVTSRAAAVSRRVPGRRKTADPNGTPSLIPRAVDAGAPGPEGGRPDHQRGSDRIRLLESLSKDPSLRFTEAGRALLRALFASSGGPPSPHARESLPPHCAYTLAALARACAQDWLDFARQLERRIDPLSTTA